MIVRSFIFFFAGMFGFCSQAQTEFQSYAKLNSLDSLDKKTGIWQEFYTDHRIKAIRQYSDDELNGISITFDENGNLITHGTFKNGKKEGVWIIYSPTDSLTNVTLYVLGNKQKSVTYSFAGRTLMKEFFDNGTPLKTIYSTPDGAIEGSPVRRSP